MSRTVESIRRSLDPALSSRLSEVELLIMACLCDGMSNKALARHCGLSESLVKVRLAEIMRKTGASNRTQVAIWTMKHGDARRSGPREPAATQATL